MQGPVFLAMGANRSGPRVAARSGRERTLRSGPQLLQQALECVAVYVDESGRVHGRARRPGIPGVRRPLDSQSPGERHPGSDRSTGNVSLRRGGSDVVRFCLGRVLQLLCRDAQRPVSGRSRAARGPASRRSHARFPLATAAPHDTVPDRGGLAIARQGGSTTGARDARIAVGKYHGRDLARGGRLAPQRGN